jgi:Dolichyl-phosphate-mannose-protein mannosyltransferase
MRKWLSFLLVTITLVISATFVQKHSYKFNMFYGDALGYYSYLPSAFIYHNLDSQANIAYTPGLNEQVAWYFKELGLHGMRSPKGLNVNQYTIGIAIMEAPFFFAADAYEHWQHLPANGYSDTYNTAIFISAYTYTILGSILLYLVLVELFSPFIALLTVLLLFIGTNLFWFTLHQVGMSHVPLFFLYSFLMWCTVRIYRKPHTLLFILMGSIIGLIILIRPTDIICISIPLLYNVYNKQTIIDKWLFIRKNLFNITTLIATAAIPVIPQLLLWKWLTGKYLYYSYGDQKFDWSHPHIIEGLFSGSNGWLAFTPLMVLAILGLFCYKHLRTWAWCIWLTLPVYIYIIYSWYCFSYINGLGSRPMIHMYPLLAVSVAAFLTYFATSRWWKKLIITALCLFFIGVNLSFSKLQAQGMLKSEQSNWAYNLQVLFHDQITYNDLVVNDTKATQPDTSRLTHIATLLCESYNDSLSDRFVRQQAGNGFAYLMKDEEHHPYAVKVKYNKALFNGAIWVRCSGDFMCPFGPEYYRHLLVYGVERKGYFLTWIGCTIENKIGLTNNPCDHKQGLRIDHYETNRWGHVSFYGKIPKNIQEGDEVTIDLWNICKTQIYLDNICLDIYK